MVTTTLERPPIAREDRSQPKRHAVVIGSGFGGLAAAVRLGARGYSVTVLEKRDQLGGRAGVWRQDGFTFDAGPTIITAPWLFEELWELCGRKLCDSVELRAVTPFYAIRFADGTVFRYSGDADAMRAEVARFNPADVDGYERFMEASRAIFDVGFTQLGDVPFSSWRDMARIVPAMVRLRSHRSVYGFVSTFLKDERLRTVFSFHPLLIGGNPFSASSIYCLIAHLERHWGVHFAMGGTNALVRGLSDLLDEQGATIRLNSGVAAIDVVDGVAKGVTLVDGEKIAADIVVSNADSATTYRELVGGSHRRRWSDRRLTRSRYSMGLFVWYFGTNKRYENVEHHTILLGPRYRELLEDIFKHKRLAADFSLYLHRPTATDNSLAPDGCDAFYVLAPVPNLLGTTDWARAAEPYRRQIETFLEQTILPGLSDAIVTSRVATPQDFHDDLSSAFGAGFGLEPVLWQSAWFRPHNRSEDIANLYLVGAGTHPGAGVPGVLSSARVLDRVVPHADAFS